MTVILYCECNAMYKNDQNKNDRNKKDRKKTPKEKTPKEKMSNIKNTEKLEDVVNRLYIVESRYSKISSKYLVIYKVPAREDARFRHMPLQMNAGAKVSPKTEISNAIQQRIDTLNERLTNNKINLTELLDGLLLVVAKKKK